MTSKYRLFAWVEGSTLADHAVVVIARSDDYMFGILHSRFHQLWGLRKGTQLESRPRYTPTTTVETFPFPDASEDHRQTISEAAAKLDHLRSQWLNPPGQDPAVLKQRTLTNLYNAPPTWLQQLHEELDASVAAAYGWAPDISDEEVLAALLDLNVKGAKASPSKRQLGLS